MYALFLWLLNRNAFWISRSRIVGYEVKFCGVFAPCKNCEAKETAVAKEYTCKTMEERCFLCGSAPPPLLYIGTLNTPRPTVETVFLCGPCRAVILKTTGATVQLRVHLWSANYRVKEAEEPPTLRFVTRNYLVMTLQRNSHLVRLIIKSPILER
jgi:hypothetical protein